ncbi:MAG: hypothetical protein KC422_18290 [Trueperaceae bacterium]|nr:hypothetical protein [Trueperaceae bacterium]
MNPFLLMSFLYLALAGLLALDASLTSFTLLPWFNGLRWLRVHLIALGAFTTAAFGMLPLLLALRNKQPRPPTNWTIWLTLNAGILILLSGIPLVNQALIFAGGTLIFAAVLLLMRQLSRLATTTVNFEAGSSLKFYLMGLAYLLLGILVGTGLWLGWTVTLGIAVPIEVHIHANNWGFMSLVFAGLIFDLYPQWSGHKLAKPKAITLIFWMMSLGALGLVLGPWTKSNLFSVPGLLLHLSATIWLLVLMIKPLIANKTWSLGLLHLISAYIWILAPVLIAPLIILGVPGFPGAGIEQNAPQALIYGWVLQFSYAVLPFLFRKAFLVEPARLGGNWFSLLAVHLGGVFLWASIFIAPYQAGLHGLAYGLWTLSFVPVSVELWKIVSLGLESLDAAPSLGSTIKSASD